MPDPKPKGKGRKPAWKNPYVIGAIVVGGLILAYYLYRREQANSAAAATNTGTSAPLDSSGGVAPGTTDTSGDGSGGGLTGDQSQSDLESLLAEQASYDQMANASQAQLIAELGGVQSSLGSEQAQLAALLAAGSHSKSTGTANANLSTNAIASNVESASVSPVGVASQATPSVQASRPGGLSVSKNDIRGTHHPQGVISIH